MHIVNPTITKRFKALDKWLQIALWGSAAACVVFLLFDGSTVTLRYKDHDEILRFDFFHESGADIDTPVGSYLQLAFLMFGVGFVVYGLVILVFTRWRQQAELDYHHAELREHAEKIFTLAKKPEASMTTVQWEIVLDEVVRHDKKALRIHFMSFQKGGETFPLPREFVVFIFDDSSTMSRGYLSSFRLYRLNALLYYVERLYRDRHHSVSRVSS